MENENKKVRVSLIGETQMFITLIFVLLKAFDKIDWSWWWVCSPLWLPIVIILVVIAIVLLVIFGLSLLGVDFNLDN